MAPSSSRFSLPALALMAGLAGVAPTSVAAQAVSNTAEFETWRKMQKEDIDGMRDKFLALAKAVPADKHGWRPMEGSRSFHQVFAHVAAEGNLESAMFGAKLPAGSVANFDAEETRLGKLPDDQLVAEMDKSLQLLSATVGGLSLDKMNASITYYGQPTLPRVAAMYTLNDLHEHLGQVVSYARMQQIVPPWSKKT
ncbi:MAG TPA: DinB family protein [Gemmatimonadales bacterium]|nr:DinB family protein [Gemmatimonadales bacterium]